MNLFDLCKEQLKFTSLLSLKFTGKLDGLPTKRVAEDQAWLWLAWRTKVEGGR